MPKILSGFDAMFNQQQKESRERSGKFIPFMRLGDDGDCAKFRIVSSHSLEAMAHEGLNSHSISAVFHRHQARTNSGREYYTASLCELEEEEGGTVTGSCQYCTEEISRSLQFMIWVYVYYVDHMRQNPDPKGDPWTEEQVGSMTVYRQVFNEFMVWQDGFHSSEALKARIQRLGSITDRDYERIRHGVRRATNVTYELIPGEPSPVSIKIKQEALLLPDLYDIAEKKVRTMPGADGQQPQAASQPAQPQHAEVQRPAVTPVDYSTTSIDDLPF